MIDYIEKAVEESMLSYDRGRRIIAGVSGGADSVALLMALHRLGFRVVAAHCNFHLRGNESMRDQEFVVRLCEGMGIELVVTEFDVDKYRESTPCSIETACRDLRYNWFYSLFPKYGASRVAVAHNADDNIETFFLNLLRGTGLRGLKGMDVDSGRVLRPLLSIYRMEIEAYLDELQQPYIIDSTNLKSDYRRNFLRNEVLPLIRERWPDASSAMTLTIANLGKDWTLLQQETERFINEKSLPKTVVLSSKSPEALIYHFISNSGGTSSQAREIARSVFSGTQERKYWFLPDYRVVLERDAISIDFDISEDDVQWTCVEIPNNRDAFQAMRTNNDQSVFYSSLPIDAYRMRVWRSGDRISPLGMSGSSLVSDIIKDAKLSVRIKSNVIVAENIRTGNIVWIEGLKRSRYDLVDYKASSFFKICRLR